MTRKRGEGKFEGKKRVAPLFTHPSDHAVDGIRVNALLPGGTVTPAGGDVRRCLSLDLEAENFGQNTGLICVRNGTIDVRTGELLPHSPEHQLRFKLDIDYDPNAACPIYDEHIRQTLREDGEAVDLFDELTLREDGEAVDLFDEFAGLTLVPDMRYQKTLYLLGPGGSGKSTLLSMLEAIHDPQAISMTPLDKIDDERYRTNLALKLVCLSSDVQTHRKVFGETFVRI